jgi:oligopeptide transport system ATP-binding protein
MNNLLSVKGLMTEFHTKNGIIHAVNGVSFDLKEGETLGIVGESGCGKSVSVMSMLRLISTPPGKITAGEVLFQGRDLLKLSDGEIRHIRGAQVSMVFQDPMTSLNPVLTIGKQVSEAYSIHVSATKEQAEERAAEMLRLVNITDAKDHLKDYPHQFSGGMRQRAMIAMALACMPQILIADEPTTALDVTIQAQIIDLVKRLQDELGMAVIWITHDLGIIAGLANRVLVMYAGYIVESSEVTELYSHPTHPYTIGLLNSLPKMKEKGKERLMSIDGLPPVLFELENKCPFAPRCKYVIDHCLKENPPLIQVNPGHHVACWVDPKTGKERQ